jgi:hypothetical protein
MKIHKVSAERLDGARHPRRRSSEAGWSSAGQNDPSGELDTRGDETDDGADDQADDQLRQARAR